MDGWINPGAIDHYKTKVEVEDEMVSQWCIAVWQCYTDNHSDNLSQNIEHAFKTNEILVMNKTRDMNSGRPEELRKTRGTYYFQNKLKWIEIFLLR